MSDLGVSAMLDVTDINTALIWHLGSNHYPPVDLRFIPTAKAAIEAANEGEWDREIAFPDGAQKKSDAAHAVIDGLHLGSFVEYEDDV